MSPASISELPSEVLEHILLLLHPAEIPKVKEASRLFLDLVSTSQYLQHRIDLFSAGLLDNPHTVCSLAERRARLREYTDGWKGAESSVRYECPLESRVVAFKSLWVSDHNLFSLHLDDSAIITFIRVPSSPKQETVEEWTLELLFRFKSRVVRSKDDLLAVVEQGIGFINIHLLSLLDGSPHEVPLRKVIPLDLGHYHNPRVIDIQISNSRIAPVIELSSFTMARQDIELIVWEWKTGGVVLEYSGRDADIGSAISTIIALHFLEGPWLLALCYANPAPQLLVFNLLLPQQDPRSWRILDLPLLPNPRCYTQCEESLAEYPEFSVDPAQKIFVVFSSDNRALVTPVELFIRRVNRVRTSPYIPWDEWADDVITVHLHPGAHALRLFDTKVLTLCGSAHRPEGWGVRMYDFSRFGQRDIRIQQVGEGAGGVCTRVLSTPKWFSRCQMGDGIPHSTRFVGNKVVCFFHQPPHSGRQYSLRIWKVG